MATTGMTTSKCSDVKTCRAKKYLSLVNSMMIRKRTWTKNLAVFYKSNQFVDWLSIFISEPNFQPNLSLGHLFLGTLQLLPIT